MRRRIRMAVLLGLVAFAWCARLHAHESPVDPIARSLWFWLEGNLLHVRYEEKISERSALLELHAMDRNRDGVIQDSERETFMAGKSRRLADGLLLQADSATLNVEPAGPVVLRRGWRQVHEFTADLSAIAVPSYRLRLSVMPSRSRPGPFQWTIGRPADLPAAGSPSNTTATLRDVPMNPALRPEGGENRVELEITLHGAVEPLRSSTAPDLSH